MTTAELVQQIQQVKSMSIVGMCKNAGKTTMLNWLLAHTGRRQVLGLTSIGRDGESTDVVTGTESPASLSRRVRLSPPPRICCAWEM